MAAQKIGGLGRGLEALISDVAVTVIADESVRNNLQVAAIAEIDINDIKPNTSQPRKTFDDEKLEELAASIEEHGIIQPILVRPASNGYEIVAGERRWRAARKAGLKTVPCVVRKLDERENLLIALIENMQREDLSPIEEAMAYEEMSNVHGLTQSEISRSVGKSRPYITNSLRLLKLPDIIKEMVSSGKLSGAHARTLAGMNDFKKQIAYANKAVNQRLSVRTLEEMVSDEKSGDKMKLKKASRVKKDKDILAAENDLRMSLGTKVNIKHSSKRGVIEIEYYSREEMERLIELLSRI